MNFRLVLLLSLLGLLAGAASVAGMLGAYVMPMLAVVAAIVIARRAPGRYFMHGFLTGFVAGILGPLVHVLFFQQYVAHNPAVAESFGRFQGINPRLVILLLTPIPALVYGLVLGLLAWVAGKTMARKATVAT